jgi:succinoglycan biosynthesis protein ExoL
MQKIVYFAHDLTDPAVHRRVKMFEWAGANVTLIGFRRGVRPVDTVAGIAAIDLGQTGDGQLARRVASVAAVWARLDRLAGVLQGANAIVARNLEMLFLAVSARRRYACEAPLAYECLDIHRMLNSRRVEGAALRYLEARLWRRVDLLLTSSPAFVRHYFRPRGFCAPIRFVENKVLLRDAAFVPSPRARPLGPPWRIGWFGMIRCRRSLEILRSLTRAANGTIEVVIRGRPSMATLPDIAAEIAGERHIRFAGPYRNPDDLDAIHADVHLSWAIDYYESGENSAWLLPNRIYEAGLYGTVPIASGEVETGHWLARRGVGVVLGDPIERQLANFFSRLDRDGYAKLAAEMRTLPRADLFSDYSDCRDLVEALCAAGVAGRSGDRRISAMVPEDDFPPNNLRRAS